MDLSIHKYTQGDCLNNLCSLNAYDTTNGQLSWSVQVEAPIGGITVSGGVVYFGYNGVISALDASTGSTLWGVRLANGDTVDSPSVFNGIVYVGPRGGQVFYALNASDGSILWQTHNDTLIISQASPTVVNGMVYIGSIATGPEFYALDALTGGTTWRGPSNYSPYYYNDYGHAAYYWHLGAISATTAVANGVLYAQGNGGKAGAYFADTGQPVWINDIGSTYYGSLASPAVANGVVYFGSDNNTIYAFDAQLGTILWQYVASAPVRSTIVANHTLFFSSDDGKVYAFQDTIDTPTPTPTETPTPTPTATPTPTNTPTPTPTPIQLSALSPAKVWVGLKNSDDVGTKFDLKAEAYKDSTLVSSGELDSFAGGSSGFNNAHLATIPFDSFTPVDFPAGSQLKVKVLVRNACVGSGHNSGFARLWYNDAQANSRFDATIGGNNSDYYLRDLFALTTTVGSGPKKTIDVQSGAKCSAFKTFGTWTITP